MPTLNRDQALAAQKRELKRETVPVPEWGGDVIVRELSAKERDEYEASTVKRRGKVVEQNLANLYDVAARLSGITKADEEELAGKNSDTGPGAGSGTV